MAVKTRDEAKEARRFGVALAALLLVLAAALRWYWGRPSSPLVLAGAAAAVSALNFLALPAWTVVFRLWVRVALAIGGVLSRLVLAVVFYGIVTPVGLLMRLFGRQPLDARFRDGRPTYWREKPAGVYTLERYQKLY